MQIDIACYENWKICPLVDNTLSHAITPALIEKDLTQLQKWFGQKILLENLFFTKP